MILLILSFFLGTLPILFLHQIPSYYLMGMLFAFGFLIFYLRRNKITTIFLGLSFGFIWVMLFATIHLHQILPKTLEGKPISMIGQIISIPEYSNHDIKFLFRSNHHLYKLTWYRSNQKLSPGDQWQLTLKLKRPRGFMNPGGFDYEKWLFYEGICGTGYVVNQADNKLIASKWFHQSIDRIRLYLQKQLSHSSIGHDQCIEILIVLITGLRSFVTNNEWEVFRKTGTNHLIAIAGLHIGLLASLIYIIVNFLWRRISYLTLRIPAQIAAAFMSLIGAIGYSLLAGFPLQTQRALIMLSVVLGSMIFRRFILFYQSIFLALFIILIVNPLSVLSISFWLSFTAVMIIIYTMRFRIHPTGFLWKWGRVQWSITLGLIPFTLWFFHETSIIGIIANLIAVPWFGFVIVPLSFIGVLFFFVHHWLGISILWIALKNIQWLYAMLKFLSVLPFANVQWSMPTIWILFGLLVSALLLLSPKGFPVKILSLFFLFPIFFVHVQHPKEGTFWLTMLDVGQGLASVIETKHHVLIYDTGPKFSDTFNAGDAVVLPYLLSRKIKRIHLMMISHGDNDHIGGADSIIAHEKVDKVLTSVPNHFKHAEYCYRGQYWDWDGVHFEVLSPQKGNEYVGNNSSCVLKVSANHRSVLLTGDIEKETEQQLVKFFHQKLSSTILIAPHHGSETSSSLSFVKAVYPQYVLFPVGYLNRFHFPNPLVMKRYQQLNSHLLDSVHSGAITINVSQKISVSQYRINHRRIWSE